ncbi:TPA: type I toxin-antitoxin system toxin Ldr family protein [Escherichia coli]|nr:type I toxin-antitoxin system toxin Ldr family protein [Escherichia coli]
MTLAELGMAFWHDLAAPVIAGILASMIVNWLNKRVTCHAGVRLP